MQVVAVGFIIGVVQDSVETCLNSAGDAVFTATAEFIQWKKEGKPLPEFLRKKKAFQVIRSFMQKISDKNWLSRTDSAQPVFIKWRNLKRSVFSGDSYFGTRIERLLGVYKSLRHKAAFHHPSARLRSRSPFQNGNRSGKYSRGASSRSLESSLVRSSSSAQRSFVFFGVIGRVVLRKPAAVQRIV